MAADVTKHLCGISNLVGVWEAQEEAERRAA